MFFHNFRIPQCQEKNEISAEGVTDEGGVDGLIVFENGNVPSKEVLLYGLICLECN